ncbi:hypothetical protein BFW88_01320 [Pseudomonas fluorescens]|uniref:Uncharacterized protein n=1 Tax=Pseudomonas lactucae TaxID=2813360 RepID=A0A9X0YH31_9PSED|nr:hypothetical protein [Pseudomonas lactucae]OPA97939.1 hypothetical protein BFW88_01320 [Pseudomonas fluorescens]MBN2979031.1 hypothetical protein [Pseudomonas lactucae]MBN2988913.1 hypothetical protein [Pseudomonas lactucae]OPB14551.1 hypothetical protein BFW92_01315 [Pseudomonas fluorescens]OPB27932.1 hypothetical protein BFW93_01320 [Pseudomonas fluorescens]
MSEESKFELYASETKVMLERLASGAQEIESGLYQVLDDVFIELDQSQTADTRKNEKAPKR